MGMRRLAVFRSRRMIALFLLGFGSGLPYYLTANTLQAWLSSVGMELETIATFNAIGLAYTFKFAWAPLFDRFALPLLGRRRGWMLVLQLGLGAAIAAMGTVDPVARPEAIAGLALAVAVLSASQDIVIDAYNADLLAPEERAAGASINIMGYRVGMMLTGGLALVMADHVSWTIVYGAMAALIAVGVVGTLLAEEPVRPAAGPTTLAESVYLPLVELVRRLGAGGVALVLAFTALYKFGDYFAQSLIIAFLKQGAGFDFTEIAAVYKGLGVIGTIAGGLAAGAVVGRFGMKRVLVAFGVVQAVTNLLYAWLAGAGASLPIFVVAVACDMTANAMGTAVFVGFLMSVCSPAVSATQFALLTSLSSIGQRVFGALFAYDVVAAVGWPGFFVATSAMAVPGLALAAVVARRRVAREGPPLVA